MDRVDPLLDLRFAKETQVKKKPQPVKQDVSVKTMPGPVIFAIHIIAQLNYYLFSK